MGLYIRVLGLEKSFSPFNGIYFSLVNKLTPLIIPLFRVSFGVFIGHDIGLGSHDRI